VIELAAVAGLARLGESRVPLTATSWGVGEVMEAALDAGCRHLVLGVGGSASTDGGIGMLQALGARVTNATGHDVGPGGLGAETAARLDTIGLHPDLAHTTVEVACDVDNPLTGPHGAAVTYGPQKGADPEEVRLLDAAMENWADVVTAATGVDRRGEPGAGAAGGVGFAAAAVLGAQLRPGVALVLDLVGFADALAGADLVVTGEGSLDEQTLRGKAPAGVAAEARAAHVPTVAVAGRCSLDEPSLRRAGFDAVYTLVDEAEHPDESFDEPGRLLRAIGVRLADRLVGAGV
jgi:glycerate 2-kinase